MEKLVSVEAIIQTDSGSKKPVNAREVLTLSKEEAVLRVWLAFALILPLLCMSPSLFAQSKRLVSQQALLFFPFSTALGIWFLGWTCVYKAASYRRARLGELFFVIGVGLSVFGIFWISPLIVQFAAIVVVFAWALVAYGGSSWTRIMAICSLFAVSVPLPGGLDSRIGVGLQSIAAWACNGFLDAISIPNILEGDALQVGANRISVSGVCSGADSLNALIAAALAILVYRRSTLLVGVLTIATVPFISVLGNMIRLLAIALGMEYFGVSLSTGVGHALIATLVFGADLACILCSHFAIEALVEPMPDSEAEKQNALIRGYNQLATWPNKVTSELDPSVPANETNWSPSRVAIGLCSVLCVLFGSLSAYSAMFRINDGAEVSGFSEELAATFPTNDAFPSEFNGIRKISFDASGNTQGVFSHGWKFDNRGNQVFVSLNFPFQGWSTLSEGYQAVGWRILDVKELEQETASVKGMAFDEFKMQNPYGLFGFVWVGFFDENGIPVERSITAKQLSRKNIISMLQNDRNEQVPISYQVQVFFESGRDLSEAELARNRKLFFEIFERVRQASETPLQKAKQVRN